ncbi:sensor histidine kinase [[Clostridium] scindens]|uniref:sensor histidine kinase n=1 Tax=Clostridium scindens (strain JCM 10418 / VPI 12708) TaxID=29347 RepID=UPI0022E4EA1D|nr:HAMP domain-containing sensor histidine kinase [[Clostridium] scindens]
MNIRKLSINKACILLGTLFLLAVGTVSGAIYLLTRNITAVWCVFLFSLFVLLIVICFVVLIRQKLVRFSDAFCGLMDDMLSGDAVAQQSIEEESLFYKINYRLGRLYEVMQENKNSIAKEQADLQELISDISHQVKTPIANLKMINSTLLEQEVPAQKRKEFLSAQSSQLDKLDFLMQVMIKTSRLETGVISLEKKEQPIYDTLAAALGGILLNAEKKQIDVQVDCSEGLSVSHDRKWTSEALFNILDNAVKYTPAGGQIRVRVECWEMYVKIDIADTGIGISEQHQGTIFKRFYREEAVHDVDGIGIGLYLAREIVTLQGGYIRVGSEIGKGSVFSVFLLRK